MPPARQVAWCSARSVALCQTCCSRPCWHVVTLFGEMTKRGGWRNHRNSFHPERRCSACTAESRPSGTSQARGAEHNCPAPPSCHRFIARCVSALAQRSIRPASSFSRTRPSLRSALPALPVQSVPPQLPVQRRRVDTQHLGRPRLLPARTLQHPGDVGSLDDLERRVG